jgi:hypothetical protein
MTGLMPLVGMVPTEERLLFPEAESRALWGQARPMAGGAGVGVAPVRWASHQAQPVSQGECPCLSSSPSRGPLPLRCTGHSR